MPKRGPSIAETALELIRARGPLTINELTPLLVAAGRTTAKDPRRAVAGALHWNRAFLEAPDGRFFVTADQLEGTVFTVRPTMLERRDGIVLVRDDLVLLKHLLEPGRRWREHADVPHLHLFAEFFEVPLWSHEFVGEDEDGEPVYRPIENMRERIGDQTADDLLGFLSELGLSPGGDDDALLRELVEDLSGTSLIDGPPGWLPPLGPRDLLGLGVHDGTIRATRLDRRTVIGPHVELAANRIAGMAKRVIGPDESWFGEPVMDLEELLTMVATEAPEVLRRPLPPLIDVIERGGLVVSDGLVAHPGTFVDEEEDDLVGGGCIH